MISTIRNLARWLVPTVMTICSFSVQAESTVLLDLVERTQQKLTEVSQQAAAVTQAEKQAQEQKHWFQEAQRRPAGSIDRQHAIAQYVRAYSKSLAEGAVAFEDLTVLNEDLVETVYRLGDAVNQAKRLSGYEVFTQGNEERLSRLVDGMDGLYTLFTVMEDDPEMAQSSEYRYARQVYQESLSELNGSGQFDLGNLEENIMSLAAVLENQGALMKIAQRRYQARAMELKALNMSNLTSSVQQQLQETVAKLEPLVLGSMTDEGRSRTSTLLQMTTEGTNVSVSSHQMDRQELRSELEALKARAGR